MNTEKKTLIIGASENPSRYAYKATQALLKKSITPILIGSRSGEVSGLKITTKHPEIFDVHTITLYVGPSNQPQIYEYVKKTRPKRVIFNPGTENKEFMNQLSANGVEVVEGCTLVMLSLNTY